VRGGFFLFYFIYFKTLPSSPRRRKREGEKNNKIIKKSHFVKKKRTEDDGKGRRKIHQHTFLPPPLPTGSESLLCVCACTTLSLIVLTEDQGRAKAFLTGRRGERNSLPQTSRVLAWCCPRIMGESVREGERGGKKKPKKGLFPPLPNYCHSNPISQKKKKLRRELCGISKRAQVFPT